MTNLPAPAEDSPPEPPEPTAELIASPPSDRAVIEDTAHVTADSREVEAAQFVTAQALDGQPVRVRYYEGRYEAKIHAGPFPSPETLRELAEIYADAPRLIFEDFQAQSAHRRDLEHAVVTTKNTLAIRGQFIGGILGGIGLIGSLIVAGVGNG